MVSLPLASESMLSSTSETNKKGQKLPKELANCSNFTLQQTKEQVGTKRNLRERTKRVVEDNYAPEEVSEEDEDAKDFWGDNEIDKEAEQGRKRSKRQRRI